MCKSITGTSGWKLLAIAVALGGAALAEKDQKTAKTEEAPAPPAQGSPAPEADKSAADEAKARAAQRAAAQKALNDRVMAQEFKVADPRQIDAYVEEQLKKKVKPVEQAPPGWRPGYTCNDLLGFVPVNWVAYRNCRYYYRYHGRYWR